PTIPLVPLENSKLVGSTNDLKPHRSRRLMRMASTLTQGLGESQGENTTECGEPAPLPQHLGGHVRDAVRCDSRPLVAPGQLNRERSSSLPQRCPRAASTEHPTQLALQQLGVPVRGVYGRQERQPFAVTPQAPGLEHERRPVW